MQAAVSIVQNLEVVHYLGAALLFHIDISVGACSSVHYWVEVRSIEVCIANNKFGAVP